MPNTTVTKQLASANNQLSFYGEIVAKDGAGAGTYLAMGSAQNSQNYLFSTGNIPLNLSTNSATRMTILGTGLVGINKTSPTAMLEVVGQTGLSTTAIDAHGTIKFRTHHNDSSEIRFQFNPGGAADAGSFDTYDGLSLIHI